MQGKREDFAEKVSVQVFSNESTAKDWCDTVTDLDDKYWTHAQIVTERLYVSTFKPKKTMTTEDTRIQYAFDEISD